MKISSIFSVRNVLRASGIVSIAVGAPMLIVPPLVVQMFLGKREDSPEPDKKALQLSFQALGIALTGSGIKSLVAPASKDALAAALSMEGLYACYHINSRFFGGWKDAKGNLKVSLTFVCATVAIVVIQTLSLSCGDKPEKTEDKDE